MGTLEVYYSEEIRHNERAISAIDIMDLFGKAYTRCQTAQIAINRLKVADIYPLKKKLFSDAECIEEANKKRDSSFYKSGSKTQATVNRSFAENRENCNVDGPKVIVQFDPNRSSTYSPGPIVPLSSATLEDFQGSTYKPV